MSPAIRLQQIDDQGFIEPFIEHKSPASLKHCNSLFKRSSILL